MWKNKDSIIRCNQTSTKNNPSHRFGELKRERLSEEAEPRFEGDSKGDSPLEMDNRVATPLTITAGVRLPYPYIGE